MITTKNAADVGPGREPEALRAELARERALREAAEARLAVLDSLDEAVELGSLGSREWILEGAIDRSGELGPRSQELFFKVFRANPAPIAVSRLADGRLVDVNDRFCELLGSRRDELVGRTSVELGFWAEPSLREELARRLRAEGSLREIEERFRHRSGEERELVASLELVELPHETLVVSMFADVTERRRGERALAESRSELRRLAGHLQDVREEEKAAMAREIHDRLGQTLTALHLDLAWVGRRLARESAVSADLAVRERVAHMLEQVDETLRSVTDLVKELRPAVLDALGLEEAVRWQVEELARRSSLDFRIRLSPCGTIDAERSTALFRILQEALTNVVRHARATAIAVRLELVAGRIELAVEDDGRGAAPEALASADSFGILGMKERAAAWGGSLEIAAVPGRGTTVTTRIPTA